MEKNELAMIKAENDRLVTDIDKLKQRLREEITRTQAGVRLDLNLEKGRMREETSKQELKIKEVDTRIEQEIAALRTSIQVSKVRIFPRCSASCSVDTVLRVQATTLQYLVGFGGSMGTSDGLPFISPCVSQSPAAQRCSWRICASDTSRRSRRSWVSDASQRHAFLNGRTGFLSHWQERRYSHGHATDRTNNHRPP